MFIAFIIICLAINFYYYRDYYFFRNGRKRKLYQLAFERSKKTRKPLLVIGDPASGCFISRYIFQPLFGLPHGYGDICIDPSGCPERPHIKKIKDKVANVIGLFGDNSHVIFTSCTLEYVNKNSIAFVLKELLRVSGKDLFVVNMVNASSSYTDRHDVFKKNSIIFKCPPKFDYFEFTTDINKNVMEVQIIS